MHPEAITSGQRKIFGKLKNFPEFYLAGGTALALQIFKFKEYKGVKLLSISEIVASKAYSLGRRATLKDYVDLYYVLKEKYLTLSKLIKISKRKYKEFDPRLFLEQLIYLKDVEDIEIQFLKRRVSKKEIERFFQSQVKKIKL